MSNSQQQLYNTHDDDTVQYDVSMYFIYCTVHVTFQG